MGIAWVVFHENVDRRLLLGALAILAGAAVLSWQGRATVQWGGAADRRRVPVLGHRQQPDAQAVVGRPGADRHAEGPGRGRGERGTGPVAWRGAAAVRASSRRPRSIGFLGYGVSLALFVLALRYLGAARTGAYFSLAPFVGAVLAVVMLHEPVSLRCWWPGA